MIKVEFTSTFNSSEHFDTVCKMLGISYKEDPDYERHFFGCDAPDVGYILHTSDPEDFERIRELAHGDLFVENLIRYD